MIHLVLAMRGLRGALAVRDSFGRLLGAGLSFAIVMQIFVLVRTPPNGWPPEGHTGPGRVPP